MQLIYVAPLSWHSFTQRPHKFVEWFHERYDGRVLWIEPYPTRFPNLRDAKRFSKAPDQIYREIPEWLQLVNFSVLPIEPLIGSELINRFFWRLALSDAIQFSSSAETFIVIGKPSKFSLKLLQKISVPSLYDMMDDFPEFYSGLSKKALVTTEQSLIGVVDNLSVSSQGLFEKWKDKKRNIRLIKNGLDLSAIGSISSASRISEKNIIGYLGTVGEWFDWDLVQKIANAFPSAEVKIIGPVYKAPPSKLEKNISIHDACSHDVALQLMKQFSVALIPFLQTPLTNGVDPIKLYEYHALGLPVVSTLFGEMAMHRKIPGVYLLGADSPINSVIQSALSYIPDSLEIAEFVRANDWSARFDGLQNFLGPINGVSGKPNGT